MTIVYRVRDGIYVNLTNRCPCACDFCIRKNADGAYGSGSLWLEREPTVEEAVAALEAEALDRCPEVVFCGYGEPTERLDDLLKIAHHLKTRQPQVCVRVNTNGLSDLIAGEPTAARFAGAVDALSISLNAPTAEEYLALCHPKFGLRSYEAMLAFAKDAKAYVPSVTMTVVGTPDMTPERIAACRAVCARIGVPLRVRGYVEG